MGKERIRPGIDYLQNAMPYADGRRERGKENERRALTLLEELVGQGMLSSARRASGKQHRSDGIDFWITLPVEEYNPDFRIPLQVKSSAEGAKLAQTTHPKIPVIVVNPHRDDERIKTDVVKEAYKFTRDTTI